MTNSHSDTKNRRGAALVEAAVCLPLMLLLVLGSIELSNGIFQQHATRAAAHECARVAASGKRTGVDVQRVAVDILTQRGLDNFDIDIDVAPRTVNADTVAEPTTTHFDVPKIGTPTSGLGQVPRGTLLRLRITVNRPALVSPFGLLGSAIHSQVYFVKER